MLLFSLVLSFNAFIFSMKFSVVNKEKVISYIIHKNIIKILTIKD